MGEISLTTLVTRLHEWVFPDVGGGDSGAAVAPPAAGGNRQVYDGFISTGSVVAGRNTFTRAEGWGGDHHDGPPSYILRRYAAPAGSPDWPVPHLGELGALARDVKRVAVEEDVLANGAELAQSAITAGIFDEIEIQLVSTEQGRRLLSTPASSTAIRGGSQCSKEQAASSAYAPAFSAEARSRSRS